MHASLIGMSTAATKTCVQADRLIKDPPVTSMANTANAEPQMKMPAFALADAVVDVSLGSSASSSISGSASQHIQQEPQAKPASAASETKPGDHTAADTQPCNAASAVLSHVPVVQLLSQLDSVKWGQVAAWAAGDSAQAAALVEHLGPSIAESVASEAQDQDQALLRLEAQVMRKKLVRLIIISTFHTEKRAYMPLPAQPSEFCHQRRTESPVTSARTQGHQFAAVSCLAQAHPLAHDDAF